MMSIAETERDLLALSNYGFPVKEIIINKVFPKDNSEFLKNRWEIQKKNIDIIKKKFSHLRIKEIPYLKSEIVGIKELERINKYYEIYGRT